MTTPIVMISGSISIRVLPKEAIASLNKIINLGFHIIIGDAPGVDSLVQNYLKSKNCQNVTVYYAKFSWSGKCRNNAGFTSVGIDGNYSDRDKIMCNLADYFLAIWDGKSRGTKANIDRLKARKVTGKVICVATAR
ncbi:MAG TPA: hypothetical protein VK203_10800 [Nostocaceae cyanobacterium]|nr:hypothetical protein [Nostocaceae cyanobacterium]